MKTLILNGSPRKSGDTMALINQLTQVLKGEVVQINAYDKKIASCTDCRYCWSNHDCIIKDDMQEVYQLVETVDVVVIASPLYFSELTGELLGVLSRFQKYYARRIIQKDSAFKLKPKHGLLILTGGGDGGPGPAIERTSILFRQLNVESVGTVTS
ncbi:MULTISPECIES: flavodoxin family protein [unclassified Fusibacter]|uniref:flavodoxin family protein n=1 Tax=unclassified Fusibacter TaxID=2624464 RepID=UPI001012D077|nr:MULTISPECIES: flavodoxin family protein [unclassified Fusibacter]MCK8058215.1 flavodoxin family protein [Fusibacter sp. A2]NPE20798.1 flavodoxin family protein [Fusibacter sp. A1]RXV63003.1 flavodoxin family protein [Fusibacter sp. A1]